MVVEVASAAPPRPRRGCGGRGGGSVAAQRGGSVAAGNEAERRGVDQRVTTTAYDCQATTDGDDHQTYHLRGRRRPSTI